MKDQIIQQKRMPSRAKSSCRGLEVKGKEGGSWISAAGKGRKRLGTQSPRKRKPQKKNQARGGYCRKKNTLKSANRKKRPKGCEGGGEARRETNTSQNLWRKVVSTGETAGVSKPTLASRGGACRVEKLQPHLSGKARCRHRREGLWLRRPGPGQWRSGVIVSDA